MNTPFAIAHGGEKLEKKAPKTEQVTAPAAHDSTMASTDTATRTVKLEAHAAHRQQPATANATPDEFPINTR